MVQTVKNKIQHGFSASAGSYDLNSSLHRTIADKLLAQMFMEPAPASVLDVGCGTGYLTGKLKNYFPGSQVIGLDFAQGMIEGARQKHAGIEWVLADSDHLPFSDGCFDRVVSNLAYQWSGNLARAFAQARRVLSNKGILACTLFGYHTCDELFQSLQEAQVTAWQITRLPKEIQVKEALVISGFKDFKIDSELFKIEFKDMVDLINWLKSIGANKRSHEGYLGRETITKAASIYHEKFPYLQGIGATFEVIRIYGKK